MRKLILLFFFVSSFIFAQSAGDVVISEVMYDSKSSSDEEWVELYNTTSSEIDISGWYLTDHSSYPATSEGDVVIPAGTKIPANGYIVIAWTDLTDFTNEVICDPTSGSRSSGPGLGNSGDNLSLYDKSDGTGILIDGSPTTKFPDLSPSNTGTTIERIDFSKPFDDASNWAASTNSFGGSEIVYGTPGAANSNQPPTGNQPPVIDNFVRTPFVPNADQSVDIKVTVTDDSAVDSVKLFYLVDGVGPDSVKMNNTSGTDEYSATIAALNLDGVIFEYWVVATDDSDSSSTSSKYKFFWGITPIGQLKALDGDNYPIFKDVYAKISGDASTSDSTFSKSSTDIYVQDFSGGIDVFISGKLKDVRVGDGLEITGKIGFYNGKEEIIPDDTSDIRYLGASSIPDTQVVTISQFLTDPETFTGKLSVIKNVSLVSGTWPDSQTTSSGVNLTITDDGGTSNLTLRIDKDTDIYGMPEPKWPVDIVGILDQYDSSSPYTEGYQLLPRGVEDFGVKQDTTKGGAADLFISEYGEGSSSNKWLELFNGTNAEIQLDNYAMFRANNGATSYGDTLFLSGTLQPGETYVIMNPSADSSILWQADLTDEITFFNGDDHIALAKMESNSWVVIDVIGVLGEDPGSAWDVAGITGATKDHTLIRHPKVMGPNADWASSAGISADSTEWLVLGKDDFSDIGSHMMGIKPEPTVYPENFKATAFGTKITLTWNLPAQVAADAVLPDGYLIWMDTVNTFTDPVDGQDPMLTSDKGFMTLVPRYAPLGEEENAIFEGLMENTEYFFVIWPFTNKYQFIDYAVTDAPIVSDTTGRNLIQIFYDGFESGLFTGLQPFDKQSDKSWQVVSGQGANNTFYFAEMNGYREDTTSIDWLISPPFDLTQFEDETLEFYTRFKYGQNNNELMLLYSTDYKGGDPDSANWDALSFTMPQETEAETWIHSGKIDVSNINSSNVTFAFRYMSDGGQRRWRVDEFLLVGAAGQFTDLPPVIVEINRDKKVPLGNDDLKIIANVQDDHAVTAVNLLYMVNMSELKMIPMTSVNSDSIYEATIPSSEFGNGDLLEYFVEAFDDAAPEPHRTESYLTDLFTGMSPIAAVKITDPSGNLLFPNAMAMVSGVAITDNETFSTGRIDFYIQDSTGGLNVFKFTSNVPTVSIGHSYTVIGKISMFNGLAEIVPDDETKDIIDNGAVGDPAPYTGTIADFLADPERFEATLVQIAGVMPTQSSAPWPTSGSVNMMITDASGDSIIMRIDSDTQIPGNPEPTWPVDIIGVFNQYNDYQVLPRNMEDIGPFTSVNEENTLPKEFGLAQNYPNPFNPSTTIRIAVPKASHVKLTVFNILGQRVATLLNQNVEAGFKDVSFDASKLNSGIYFYRMEAGNFVDVKKMMLIK